MAMLVDNEISDSVFAESDQFSLSSAQYVNWVKHSLNRQFGTSMPADGVPNDRYRSQVLLFQRKEGRPETGHVDKRLQNIIIKRNEGNRAYMNWVRTALATPGIDIITEGPRSAPNSTGSLKSAGLRIGIHAFQKKINKIKKNDLTVDGFIGAKTESKLMSSSGTKPPGYIVPRRKRKPVLRPAITLKPLTSGEMRQAIFFILGRHPVDKSLKILFSDLVKMVPKFAKVLGGGSLPWLALARAYVDIWREQFGKNQIADFWYMVGSAYGAVDGSARSLNLKSLTGVELYTGKSKSTDPMIYRIAFRNGYRNFRAIQSRISSDTMGAVALSHLQVRIDATTRRGILVMAAYRALRDIYLNQHPRSIYIETRGLPRFKYPTIGIDR